LRREERLSGLAPEHESGPCDARLGIVV